MERGRIADFDAVRGIGTVAADGGAAYGFHAANIADGSRRIEIDTAVVFDVLARFGAWEATRIHPI